MTTTDEGNRMLTTVPPAALPPLSPAPASYIPIRNLPRSIEYPRDVQNNDVSRLPNRR